jgi:4-amino-4-deoxy-L-arabinose transferase-like glycosyltransferase
MLAGTMLALLILDVGSDFLSIKAWLAATRWWWKTQPWMMIIFLPAIMGPWTYLVHKRAPAFISTSVFQNYLRPIFGKPMNHRWTMPGFYLMAIWPSFMPWSLVLPVAVIKAWQNRRLAAVRYCLAATFGPLVVIEMVAQKLPHYLLPMFPAMAFLVADFVVRTVRGQYRELRTRKSKQITIAWSIGLAAIAFAPWLLMLPVFRYPALPYAAMAALTLSGLIAVGVTTRLFVKEQFGPVFLSMGTSSLFILTIVSLTFLPNFAPLCASRRASEAIWQTGFKPEDSVALMSYAEPSITFYLDGAGIDYGGDEYFPATPMSDWPQWIVMTSDRADRMPAMATQQYEPLGSFRSMSLGSKTGSGAVVVMRRK